MRLLTQNPTIVSIFLVACFAILTASSNRLSAASMKADGLAQYQSAESNEPLGFVSDPQERPTFDSPTNLQHPQPKGSTSETHEVNKPLFADPNYHGSCDPEIVWNPELKEWFIYYTGRRATREKATYVGTPIGVISSPDLSTWRFRGYCNFDAREGKPDNDDTHWAPGIIVAEDRLHMFVTYKASAEPPWGGNGVIRHYVAPVTDPIAGWKLADVPEFNQPDPIDVSILQVGDEYRAYYRVGKGGGIQWATSNDLKSWENRGKCLGAVNAKERGFGYQEAPYVFQFQEKFWMLTDPHKGLAVFHSPDGIHWEQQQRILEKPGTGKADATLARHPSVAVLNERAFIFYHTEPNRPYPTPPAEQRTPEQKISFLQMAELTIENGVLTCDRDQAVCISQIDRRQDSSPESLPAENDRVLDRKQPNIVIYLSDDHSQFDSSLYGNKNIPTPNFEKLAADGMTFTHAFVASPSCAPSRAAMLTGLMPARNGAEANHTYPRPDIHCLIQDLQAAGYEVASFGKVAHGNPQQVKRYGFDFVGNGKPIDQVKSQVQNFLKRRAAGEDPEKPLCLFVGTTNPHVPWTSTSTFDPTRVEFPPHHLDTPATRKHRAAYYQEIKELDEFLGELRSIAQDNLGDNVLFIHTSDHGSQWPFGKWTLYDYGIRVPFIASWNGQIAAETKSDAMISWVDLLPTLLEIGGAETPAGLDGRSFADVLLGKREQHREAIFTTHTGDGNKNIFPIRSIRTREWKLIHNLHPEFAFTNHSDLDRKPMAGAYWTEWAELAKTDERAKQIVERYYQRPEWELYHVSEDPWEQSNLIDNPEHAERVQLLKRRLADWMAEQGDQELVHREPRRLEDRQSWHPDFYELRAREQNKSP